MHTCDIDCGRTVVLMHCVLLMLKLRLWEEVRDWVGPIKSNRSAEAGAETGAGAGAAAGPAVMAPKRSFPLVLTTWADAGIWPPGKAFHSPKSPLVLEAGAAAMGKRNKTVVWISVFSIQSVMIVLWAVKNHTRRSQHVTVIRNKHLNSEASLALCRTFSVTTSAMFKNFIELANLVVSSFLSYLHPHQLPLSLSPCHP